MVYLLPAISLSLSLSVLLLDVANIWKVSIVTLTDWVKSRSSGPAVCIEVCE